MAYCNFTRWKCLNLCQHVGDFHRPNPLFIYALGKSLNRNCRISLETARLHSKNFLLNKYKGTPCAAKNLIEPFYNHVALIRLVYGWVNVWLNLGRTGESSNLTGCKRRSKIFLLWRGYLVMEEILSREESQEFSDSTHPEFKRLLTAILERLSG